MENIALNTKPLTNVTGRIFSAAGVLGIAAGVFVVGYFNPTTAGFFPVCPLHELTGLNCPGCGLTRGFHALFHGDILTALHFNALLPIYSFLFGYLVISMTLNAVRGKGLSWGMFQSYVLWGMFMVMLGYGIIRNLPFYPFNLLAI